MPICVTETLVQLGNLTEWEIVLVIKVKMEGQQTMWSVAPVSIIQGKRDKDCDVCAWLDKQRDIPAKLEVKE